MIKDNRIVLFPEGGEFAPCVAVLPRRANLPVVPLSAGWQQERGWEKRIFWDNSVRTFFGVPGQAVLLFQYTLSGTAVFKDEQHELELTPGTGFLVPFGSKTSYWLPQDREWEWVWVAAQGKQLHHWGEMFVREYGYCFKLPPDRGAVQVLAKLLVDRMTKRNLDAEEVSRRTYQVFMELPRTLRTATGSSPSSVADRALMMIENGFVDPQLNVSALAASLHMTRSHFTRLFTAETGMSPGKTIENRRLHHSRELIALSELSVKEICFSCGYRNVSHFCAQFKKRFGCTPGSLG
jgi:AraC-like DNA-binding protein